MDHMMPGMDGIEATARIREIGTEYAKNIPVIALTANAIVGNEGMFLSKGFQAFLSKPIDLPRLDEAIRRWVRDKSKENVIADDSPQSEHQKEGISIFRGIEISGLNIEKGVERFSGDEEAYLQVLHSYATHTNKLLDSIEKISVAGLAEYATIIHGIKGSSRGIFADMIGDAAEELENAAKNGDYDLVESNNKAFHGSVQKFIKDLEKMFSNMDAKNPKSLKDKPDAELLSKLLAACKSFDADGVDEVIAEIDKYQYDLDGGLVSWLCENVKLSNFKQIIQRLSALDS
jgi:CheY-like chemotaxis protein